MEKLTFKKAVELRKLIESEKHRIQFEANPLGIELSDAEMKTIISMCKQSLVPGMPKNKIQATIDKAIENSIHDIRRDRLASNTLARTDDLPMIRVDSLKPKS